MKEKPKKIEFPYKVREKTFFSFAKEESAQRVAIALSFAGYYVRCTVGSNGYTVYVYTDREV